MPYPVMSLSSRWSGIIPDPALSYDAQRHLLFHTIRLPAVVSVLLAAPEIYPVPGTGTGQWQSDDGQESGAGQRQNHPLNLPRGYVQAHGSALCALPQDCQTSRGQDQTTRAPGVDEAPCVTYFSALSSTGMCTCADRTVLVLGSEIDKRAPLQAFPTLQI